MLATSVATSIDATRSEWTCDCGQHFAISTLGRKPEEITCGPCECGASWQVSVRWDGRACRVICRETAKADSEEYRHNVERAERDKGIAAITAEVTP